MKWYKIFGIATIVSVLLLFLLGGLVRATGSGMGCPDWPKCFGLWSPPTCECQLPDNYKQFFLQKRIAKVKKFCSTLRKFGMAEKADFIEKNKLIYVPEEFNFSKAWIEYINRLFGVLSGLFSLLFLINALIHRKGIRKKIVFVAIGFLLLLINAWLGSIVVATNLLPGFVTIHFILTFACLFFYIKSVQFEDLNKFQVKDSKPVFIILSIFIFVQILLGVISREQVDIMRFSNKLLMHNSVDINGIGKLFFLHRYLSFPILFMACFLFYKNRKNYLILLMAIFCIIQIGFGASNLVFNFPWWSSTMHIFIGSLIPIFTFILLIHQKKAKYD